MTIEALAFINTTLNNAGIKYEFGEWSDVNLPSPYWVGEYIDEDSLNEDGLTKTNFILTGTSMNSWLTLMKNKETIEGLFPSVGGKVAMLNNGSAVAIFFDTSTVVPTDTMELKRIQINLNVQEWKGK